ncbi:hypothetical protein [Brachyspira murdochii]|uniref:hypothetical protein n=1 Tax=Brachyspira murdochii TaxID=84378 RepID=UPI0012F4B094|nr:hypothetical protein [Brachyspira murdochii]
MKKLLLLMIYCFLAILLLTSCGGHFFNPRYYYNKKDSASFAETPDTAPEKAPEQVPENEDPFKNGDWNNPNYGGYEADKFASWLFKVSFQDDKLPIYTFFEDDTRKWISGVMDWNNVPANYYQARDGENKTGSMVGDVSITGLKIYQYVANNPLYDSSGYLEGRLDRFNFYSIDGKASAATLKQYLIAVDTYSKFVFAFGAITGTTSLLGEKVPTEFEAIEKHADKRPFFEYDPIGYVDSTGKVVLYEHYKKEFVAAPTDYVPKVHTEFETMAKHTENGQGSSPYLKVDVSSIDPDTILDNFKNKKYAIRDKLVLYAYTFDDDANTLTLTSEHFYNGTLSTVKYTFSKVAGLTAVEYTNASGESIIINGFDEYNKIKDGVREEYILDYQDPGPDFIYRVAGKIYKNADENRTYEFSTDGMSFKYTENGKSTTYYFIQQSDPSEAKAAYSKNGSVFWGIKLSDYNGTKDGQISGGLESLNLNPGTSMIGDLSSYVAYIDQSSIPSEFVETVKGKTYFYRDYQYKDSGNGNSLNAYKYVFNDNANELTYIEMVYKQEDVSTKYTLESVSGSVAVYKDSSGEKLNISLGFNPNMIYNTEGVALGDCTATDYGPVFLDIVRGSEYIAEDKSYSYKFSEDGKLLTFTYASGESIQYDYTQIGTEYFKAAYKQQNTWFPRYWALRVTSLGGVLEMSTGSLAFPTDILRDAAYGWKAILGSGSLVKDAFLNAIAGRVFEVRNGTDSTKLERYTFSSGGAFITYEQIDWYTDTAVSSASITYDQYTKVSDTEGTYKYTDTSGKLVSIKFSVDSLSPSTLTKDNAVAGYYNYQDPGPYIYDVIKNKTYKRSDGSKYVVDNTGKSIDYYEDGSTKKTTYTFSKVNEDNHLEAAYYDPKAGNFIWDIPGYWAVEIMKEDKDTNLYVSSGYLQDPDSAIRVGAYNDPYVKE